MYCGYCSQLVRLGQAFFPVYILGFLKDAIPYSTINVKISAQNHHLSATNGKHFCCYINTGCKVLLSLFPTGVCPQRLLL